MKFKKFIIWTDVIMLKKNMKNTLSLQCYNLTNLNKDIVLLTVYAFSVRHCLPTTT